MKRMKLNELEAQALTKKEQSHITGGEEYGTTNCGCACAYANNGGSSEHTNGKSNYGGSLHSPGMIQVTYKGSDYNGRVYQYTVWEKDKSKGG